MTSSTYLLPFGVMIVVAGFLLPGPPGDIVETIEVLLLMASMYYDIRRWKSQKSDTQRKRG